MTSRKEFKGDSPDTLGLLVSATLHQSVAGAEPPSHVWERIERQVRQLAVVEQVRRQVILDQRPVSDMLDGVDARYLSVGGVFPIL